ncbi:early nodulin-like protein 8 [Coffea arabica]|uniref:Early nodulin-like protein 8 n=1 Tax=Coffea arabica TaxID=13443 RepID=A0A6P6TNR9_COFAR|nr:mavicyanin-like [Coffea arabica]
MASLRISRCQFLHALQLYLLIQTATVCCYQYKVGDLDAWNVPSSANPDVYHIWSSNHNFTIGDSLLFLYPPSQDSVIQVTAQSYKSCNLKDPILTMNDGNSLFNITSPGLFYFTSGVPGHCEKSQKIRIAVPGNGSYVFPPDDASTAPSPSYPTVFGPMPMQETAPSSAPLTRVRPVSMSAATLLFLCVSVIAIGRV